MTYLSILIRIKRTSLKEKHEIVKITSTNIKPHSVKKTYRSDRV